MTDLALRVENLSKRYRIGQSLDRANGRASLLQKAAAPFSCLAGTLREPPPGEIIWSAPPQALSLRLWRKLVSCGRMGCIRLAST